MNKLTCPSLHPKKCDGELKVHTRHHGIRVHNYRHENNDGPLDVRTARCEKCGKVWTDESLRIEGLDIRELRDRAQ